ncbi:DUF748 domain-containing protein [Paucibacter sp. R3-3]|uniref:DUF748 domain-containing protein n=1 Tax=Roseateles agri TaxID=3098619 RepID=A0ABU5DJB7_9BURK|nr:DUF748 domain-containing protein [Paucibacter sp. R3-3]MDY0745833.1 DUF748 domain-containing protein [Paucibacter sp. R3-3]
MRMAGEALGRPVSVADVHFEPWRLALALDGLQIAGAKPSDPPLLTLAHVETTLSLRSIWHLNPVLSSLRIERPVLRLSRTSEGHYDVDDLIARFSKPSAPEANAEPARFGLYNIQLHQGQVLFDDQPVKQKHELSDLQIELPFLSTLAADVEVAVKPLVSGKLNGVSFGSDGQLLPFAAQRQARLDLKIDKLDLAPYLDYQPADLPLRLKQGHVDLKLSANFSQPAKDGPQLQLSGEIGLGDVALQTPAGQPWLDWRELHIALKDVQPLRRHVQLGAVQWTGVALRLNRDANGHLWLPGGGGDISSGDTPAAASTPWTIGLDGFELKDAAVDWHDASLPAPVALSASDIQAKLGALSWPLKGSTPLNYALRIAAPGGKVQPAQLQGAGSLAAEQLSLKSGWQDLSLADFGPYLQAQLPAALKGQFSGQVTLAVQRPLEPDAANRATLELQDLRVAKLALETLRPAEPVFAAEALELDALKLDLGAKLVQAGELSLRRPSVQAVRAADGRWRHDALMPPSAAATSTAQPEPASAWRLALQGIAIDQGSLRLQDAQAGDAAIEAKDIKLRLQNLAWPASSKAAIPAELSLALDRARDNKATNSARSVGRLQWKGQVLLAPLSISGKLQADQLPVHLVGPYLDKTWGIQLRRADLGLKGEFAATQASAGWQASWNGDVHIGPLRVTQAIGEEGQGGAGAELLRWQTLDLNGLALRSKPGEPMDVTVANALLDDYYMRLNIDEKGRFNVSDLGGAGAPKTAEAPGAAASAAAPPTSPASSPALRLSLGGLKFSKGQVDFSDHFVRPNYSAALSEVNGTLGAFTTGPDVKAPLSMRGKVQGTGDLDVEGWLNPTGAPLTMDIKARTSDIELPPLSPYAAKYAGYAITRGKLSSQVEYKIDASGQLQASNKITLDQLTFGDHVDGPDATTLPVLLAVALLKDSNGVIDLDLPVSGSINDPEFSIGGIVWKLIGNLLKKALLSPFSLFSGSDGGDASQAAFAPGSAEPGAPEQLDKVAKMLAERPGLDLTITGWAGAAADSQALQQKLGAAAADAERKRAERRQQRGAAAAAAPAAAASAPPVSDEQLTQLATARASAIRDALIAKGIANGRLFLATPRLADAANAADWQPHAELSLSAR